MLLVDNIILVSAGMTNSLHKHMPLSLNLTLQTLLTDGDSYPFIMTVRSIKKTNLQDKYMTLLISKSLSTLYNDLNSEARLIIKELRTSLEQPLTWGVREFVIPVEGKVGHSLDPMEDIDLDNPEETLRRYFV